MGSKSRSQFTLKECDPELDKGNNLCSQRIHFYFFSFVDKLMRHYIFVQEFDDPSISDIRKQVRRDVCQELVDHSDVDTLGSVKMFSIIVSMSFLTDAISKAVMRTVLPDLVTLSCILFAVLER